MYTHQDISSIYPQMRLRLSTIQSVCPHLKSSRTDILMRLKNVILDENKNPHDRGRAWRRTTQVSFVGRLVNIRQRKIVASSKGRLNNVPHINSSPFPWTVSSPLLLLLPLPSSQHQRTHQKQSQNKSLHPSGKTNVGNPKNTNTYGKATITVIKRKEKMKEEKHKEEKKRKEHSDSP